MLGDSYGKIYQRASRDGYPVSDTEGGNGPEGGSAIPKLPPLSEVAVSSPEPGSPAGPKEGGKKVKVKDASGGGKAGKEDVAQSRRSQLLGSPVER